MIRHDALGARRQAAAASRQRQSVRSSVHGLAQYEVALLEPRYQRRHIGAGDVQQTAYFTWLAVGIRIDDAEHRGLRRTQMQRFQALRQARQGEHRSAAQQISRIVVQRIDHCVVSFDSYII